MSTHIDAFVYYVESEDDLIQTAKDFIKHHKLRYNDSAYFNVKHGFCRTYHVPSYPCIVGFYMGDMYLSVNTVETEQSLTNLLAYFK